MAITILDFSHTTQGNYMNPSYYIDSFQSLKRSLTNKVITDEILNKAANSFIDAQTAWAKMVAENSIDLTKHYFDQIAKVTYTKKDSK
jgi:hypothetical protein